MFKGIKVKYIPHPDAIVYELSLEGKTGTILSTRTRHFDILAKVDFGFKVESAIPINASVIFSEKCLSKFEIDNNKIKFKGVSYKENGQFPIHGHPPERDKNYEIVKIETSNKCIYGEGKHYSIEYIHHYYHFSIGPVYDVSADNLVILETGVRFNDFKIDFYKNYWKDVDNRTIQAKLLT